MIETGFPTGTAMTESDYDVRIEGGGLITAIGKRGGRTSFARIFLDDKPLADAFWASLPTRLADWGDVALAVYAADRLCRRPNNRTTSEWGRLLSVEIPVRDPQFWSEPGTRAKLCSLLSYLSDDKWQLRFVKRAEEPRPAEHPTLFPEQLPQPVLAALFSGGLDSLAGLIELLTTNKTIRVALFSAHTGRRTQKPQRMLLSEVERFFPGRLFPVSASFGFRERSGGAFDGEERSQRTRAFVFQTLGLITAELAGGQELQIFENGIGAINLPYLESQIGSQSNRATNPMTLVLMAEFAERVLGHRVLISLPFLARTKGEMISVLADHGFQALIRESISCDHFPQRCAGADQCGACSSCLLRRQALYASGLEEFDRPGYVHDVIGGGTGPRSSGWFVLHAMDAQVHRIESGLAEASPFQAMIEAFPTLHEAALTLHETGRDVSESDLVSLYARYASEWNKFRAVCSPGKS